MMLKKMLAAASIAMPAIAVVGCKSGDDVSFAAISRDLTPELQGSTERPIDVSRNMAVTNNLNMRLLSDDLGRVWYTNHPSSLSPLPIVKPSTQPH
jgi:hypothetical protein